MGEHKLVSRKSEHDRSAGDAAGEATVVTDALDELWAAAPQLDRGAVWAEVSLTLAARPGRVTRVWRSLFALPARMLRTARVAATGVLLASTIGVSTLLLTAGGASASLLSQIEDFASAADRALADGELDADEADDLTSAARELAVAVDDPAALFELDDEGLAHIVATLTGVNGALEAHTASTGAVQLSQSVLTVTTTVQGALSSSTMSTWEASLAATQSEAAAALELLLADLDAIPQGAGVGPASRVVEAATRLEAFILALDDLADGTSRTFLELQEPLGPDASAAASQLEDWTSVLADIERDAERAFQRVRISLENGALPDSTSSRIDDALATAEAAVADALAQASTRVDDALAEAGARAGEALDRADSQPGGSTAGGSSASGSGSTAGGSSASVVGSSSVVSSTFTLVTRAQSGDQGAFEILRSSRNGAVAVYVHAVVGDGAVANEVIARVFERTWAELSQLDDPDQFDAWLMQLARDEALAAVESRLNELQARLDDQLEGLDIDLSELLGSILE